MGKFYCWTSFRKFNTNISANGNDKTAQQMHHFVLHGSWRCPRNWFVLNLRLWNVITFRERCFLEWYLLHSTEERKICHYTVGNGRFEVEIHLSVVWHELPGCQSCYHLAFLICWAKQTFLGTVSWTKPGYAVTINKNRGKDEKEALVDTKIGFQGAFVLPEYFHWKVLSNGVVGIEGTINPHSTKLKR